VAVSQQRDGIEVRWFAGASDQIREARSFVRRALEARGCTIRLNDAVLMVSEIVTNAVTYGHGAIEVSAGTQGGRVHVAVTNTSASDGMPHLMDPADHDFGGRGLLIVDQLADAWGASRDRGRTTVWFELARPTGAQ
jgi:anti-sigma regulatory factor (Ser/Thr protein kinase)